jgi:hypothetical protein
MTIEIAPGANLAARALSEGFVNVDATLQRVFQLAKILETISIVIGT